VKTLGFFVAVAAIAWCVAGVAERREEVRMAKAERVAALAEVLR
jgi:hypothetical protein